MRILISKYNQQEPMKQLQSYLSSINKLTATIRQLQTQNGYASQQIDQYLIKVLKDNLDDNGEASNQNVEPFISRILTKSKQQWQNVLINIIQLLQIQVSALTRSNTDSVLRLPEFVQISSTITPNKCTLNDIFDNSNLQEDRYEYKTPKYKYKEMKQMMRQTEETNREFDNIEKSIQQTLERTRKLKKYLNSKIKQDKMSKIKFDPNLRRLQQMFID